MSATNTPSPNNRYRAIIKKLVVEDRLSLPEIKRKLSGRISDIWIESIYRDVRRDLGPDSPFVSPSSKGGFKKHHEQPKISPLHVSIGIRLSNFRNIVKKMGVQQFCDHYDFSNHSRLSAQELGIRDFTLVELQRLAEIMGVPIEELMKTFSDNIYKRPA
jgi:hypothetical protein